MTSVHVDTTNTQEGEILTAERFQVLYEQCQPKGVRWVARAFPRLAQDAEDIVQQAFLHVWEVCPTMPRGEDAGRAYMFVCIRRQVFKVLEQRASPTVPPTVPTGAMLEASPRAKEESTHFPSWLASRLPSVEQTVLMREELALIAATIAQLPGYQQMAVTLLMEGCSVEDVHAMLQGSLQCSLQSLRTYLSSARRVLRVVLDRPAPGPSRYVQLRHLHQVGRGWSPQYAACQQCGTTTIAHEGRGLCKRCYLRALKARTRAARVSPIAS